MPTEISGFPTFNAQIGGSSAIGTSEIVASVNTTAVGTISNTNETDLMTYVLPANTLNANGIGVRITAWGNANVAANNETIKLYFGGATILSLGPSAFGNGNWYLQGTVTRTSSNNQTIGGYYLSSPGNGAFQGTTSQTDTAAITIKVTGQNGVATVNGVQQTGMVVEVINLPGGGAVPNPYLPASLNQSTASQVIMPMGTGAGTAVAHGVANVNVTAVGTIANTNETDLITYSLPANSLSANGKGVRITAIGNTLAAANNQTIKLYLGSQVLLTWNGAFGTTQWRFHAEVLRTSSGNQVYFANAISNVGGSLLVYSSGAASQTDTAAITIKVTGQNGVATVDGVKQLSLIVEFIN